MPRIQQSRIAVPGPSGTNGTSGTIAIYRASDGAYIGPATRLDIGAGMAATDIGGTTRKQLDLVFGSTADTVAQGSALTLKADKAWVVNAYAATDVTTTSATAATIPALSFAIGANETWTADCVCRVGCSASGGIKWLVSRPSGYTLFQCLMQGNGPSLQAIESQIANGTGLGATAFCTVVTTVGWMRISVMVANGATAGTVSLNLASATATQTSTVYAGSYMTARRVS